MQLGVSSFAFGWAVGVAGHPPPRPMSGIDLIAFARARKLSLVQLGDHLPLATYPETQLAQLYAYAQLNQEVVELEVGARGLTEPQLERYLNVAVRLKSRLLRFVIDGPEHEPAPADVTALVRNAVPALQAAEVCLGLENHDRFSARALRRIVEAAGSPQVGICLDTVNSLGAGEGLEHVLDQLGPVTVNLHLKDYAISRIGYAMGFVVEGRPAGQGRLDVPGLLAQLQPHGRCRTAVLETWTPPEATIAATIAKERHWAEASLDYLKPLFRP